MCDSVPCCQLAPFVSKVNSEHVCLGLVLKVALNPYYSSVWMVVLINTSILDTTCSMTLLPWTVHCLEDEQLAAVWWRHILKGRRGEPYNFATNMVKVYLSTHTSSLSAFVIWKTHTVAKKSRGRQLNAKVCGMEVPFFWFFVCYFNDNSKTV